MYLVCMHILYASICVFVFICRLYMYTCMYVYMYVCMYDVRLYVRTCVCICVYVCKYLGMYVCLYDACLNCKRTGNAVSNYLKEFGLKYANTHLQTEKRQPATKLC